MEDGVAFITIPRSSLESESGRERFRLQRWYCAVLLRALASQLKFDSPEDNAQQKDGCNSRIHPSGRPFQIGAIIEICQLMT
jgi:hypothetical protein